MPSPPETALLYKRVSGAPGPRLLKARTTLSGAIGRCSPSAAITSRIIFGAFWPPSRVSRQTRHSSCVRTAPMALTPSVMPFLRNVNYKLQLATPADTGHPTSLALTHKVPFHENHQRSNSLL